MRPLLQLEPAEQRAHVGVLLGRRAAGRHRRAHGGQRAGEVAVQLAEVGHARVGGEVGLAVDHLLQRAAGLGVAPELDEGVDDGAEGLDDRRRQRAGAQRVAQAGPEVVARELERAALGQRAGVVGAQRRARGRRRPGRGRRSPRRRSRAPSAGTRRPAASSRRRAWARRGRWPAARRCAGRSTRWASARAAARPAARRRRAASRRARRGRRRGARRRRSRRS